MKKIRQVGIVIFLLAVLMTTVTLWGYDDYPILVSWALLAMIILRVYLHNKQTPA